MKFILYKASAAYPHIAISKETLVVWVEQLSEVPFESGVNHLNQHIKSSNYFPSIADIIKRDPDSFVDYNQLKLDTERLLRLGPINFDEVKRLTAGEPDE